MESKAGTKRSRKLARPKQLELDLPTWGGARKGAGRKRVAPKARVRHRKRVSSKAHPVHVTLRMRANVPSLRTPSAWAVIVRVLRAARGCYGLTVYQYSVLGNHLHLIVEHDGGDSLARGMRGLCTRLAAQLNALFRRSGALLADRYHARALTTPLEVRRALAYVLLNYRKHALADSRRLAPAWVDRYSSAPKFDGWRTSPQTRFATFDFGTAPARTWLLGHGWRKHGLLALDETPVDRPSRPNEDRLSTAPHRDPPRTLSGPRMSAAAGALSVSASSAET
jgi:putative transposase